MHEWINYIINITLDEPIEKNHDHMVNWFTIEL